MVLALFEHLWPKLAQNPTREQLRAIARGIAPNEIALALVAATFDAGVGLAVEVNGELQTTISLPVTGPWNNTNFVWSSDASLVLPAGQSVVRLRHLSDWRTDIRALYVTCPADYNEDGGVDGADLQAFFETWQQGVERADINADGGVDGNDIEAFFVRWAAGGC